MAPLEARSPLPRWFQLIHGGFVALIAGTALAGVPLAMLGWFRPVPFCVLAAVIGAAVFVGWTRTVSLGAARSAHTASAVALALAVGFTIFQARLPTEHLIVDRDPGVYTVTAKWLAGHGTLLVDTDRRVVPPADQAVVRFDTAGFYAGAPGGRLYPQFVHLLPVLMAPGDWIAGTDGLVRVPALLGGVALLSVFAFAASFLRPWTAVAVMALLSINLTMIVFGRDAYTEVVSVVLVFAALALLASAERTGSKAAPLIAGLLLGLAVMARLDAILYVGLVASWVALGGRRWLGRHGAALLGAGAALPCAIAGVDGYVFARPYVDDLSGSLLPLLAFAVVAVIAAVLAHWLGGEHSRRARWMSAHRRLIGRLIAAVVALGFAFGALVRPGLGKVRTGRAPEYQQSMSVLQAAEGVTIDPTRTYAEQSVRWLAWYLGPVALIAGVLGLVFVVLAITGGGDRPGRWPRPPAAVSAFAFLFLGATALYAWRPSIDPNQLWAMRRFFPVTVPGLIVLAGAAGEIGWAVVTRHGPHRSLRKVAAIVALLGMVLGAAWIPLEQAGVVADHKELEVASALERLCDVLPARSFVLIAQPGLFADRMAMPLRAMCGFDVAIGSAAPADPTTATRLAADAAAAGRPFVVLSDVPQPFSSNPEALGDPRLIVDAAYRRLELSIESVPDTLWSEHMTVWMRSLRGV